MSMYEDFTDLKWGGAASSADELSENSGRRCIQGGAAKRGIPVTGATATLPNGTRIPGMTPMTYIDDASRLAKGAASARNLLYGAGAFGAMEGAYDGFNTSTDTYRKRMGLDPSDPTDTSLGGIAKDTLVRGVGVMSDVGRRIIDSVPFVTSDMTKMVDAETAKPKSQAVVPTKSKSPEVEIAKPMADKPAVQAPQGQSSMPSMQQVSMPKQGKTPERQQYLDAAMSKLERAQQEFIGSEGGIGGGSGVSPGKSGLGGYAAIAMLGAAKAPLQAARANLKSAAAQQQISDAAYNADQSNKLGRDRLSADVSMANAREANAGTLAGAKMTHESALEDKRIDAAKAKVVAEAKQAAIKDAQDRAAKNEPFVTTNSKGDAVPDLRKNTKLRRAIDAEGGVLTPAQRELAAQGVDIVGNAENADSSYRTDNADLRLKSGFDQGRRSNLWDVVTNEGVTAGDWGSGLINTMTGGLLGTKDTVYALDNGRGTNVFERGRLTGGKPENEAFLDEAVDTLYNPKKRRQ